MFYASIEGIDDDKLEFLGFRVVYENDRFKLYLQYDGTEHIVSKHGKKYLMVEDMNDAIILNSQEVIRMPNIP